MNNMIHRFLDKVGSEVLYRRVLKNCRNVVHTASEFTENNPILSKGVVGFESDTKKFKVGDGSTLWKALPYFNYSRTELDNLFNAKADKNNTYTIEQVNEALDNIKDLFKEPVVFGGIINEEIIPIQASIDRTDHTQVFFCKPLNSFYYRIEEFGTTKYYANWNTKENYVDKYDYPYVGKLYFNASNEKYYYYSLTGLKELVMDTITYFENLLDDSDTDIEISYQSASDESIGVVIWSKKFNRFVFSTDEEGDAVYYDNWSTRDLYMVGQSAKLMHFYLNGTDGKLYFTDPEGILTKVTDDFLKAESNQVSKFIPITDINNAFDVNTVFNNNPLLAKDFHWKYYVTANRRSVVGILEITVGLNNSGIEITERFTTSWALSNNTFRPAGEGHNIYTRHCYSYRDDSREIMPGIWTAWYKYSERFTTSEKTKLTELPTNNKLKSTLDKKVEEVTLEKTSDLKYTLKVDGQAAGVINIPEDQLLKSANYDSTSHKLTLVFTTTEGEKTTEIDLTELIEIYTAGDGLQKSDNKFAIKIDPATEPYLTVTSAGLKVSGINDALATKAGKNSVYTKTEVDTKFAKRAFTFSDNNEVNKYIDEIYIANPPSDFTQTRVSFSFAYFSSSQNKYYNQVRVGDDSDMRKFVNIIFGYYDTLQEAIDALHTYKGIQKVGQNYIKCDFSDLVISESYRKGYNCSYYDTTVLHNSPAIENYVINEEIDSLDKQFNQLKQEQIQGGVYDVSAHNNGAIFESLQALLKSSNLSTLIPISVRHGGMSIRFINSDNKYVQYRLMANAWSTIITNWQGVDDEPTAGSDNLVKSGGVAEMFGLYKVSDNSYILGTTGQEQTLSNVCYITVPYTNGERITITGTYKLLFNENPVYYYNFFNNNTFIGGTNNLSNLPAGIENANICKINFAQVGTGTITNTIKIAVDDNIYYFDIVQQRKDYKSVIDKVIGAETSVIVGSNNMITSAAVAKEFSLYRIEYNKYVNGSDGEPISTSGGAGYVEVPYSYNDLIQISGTYRVLYNPNPVYSYNFYNGEIYIGGTSDLESLPTGIENATKCKINFRGIGTYTFIDTVVIKVGNRTYYLSGAQQASLLYDTNKIATNYLFSLLGLDKSIKLCSYKPLGVLTKGYVCLTCDDGAKELVTKTIPLIKSLKQEHGVNIPLTMGLMPDSYVITHASELEVVNEMLEDYGCSVAIHGRTSYTTFTPSELVAHLNSMKSSLEDVLSVAPSSIIFPNHDYNEMTATIAGSYYGVCCTGGMNKPIRYGINCVGPRSNMYTLFRDSLLNQANTQQRIKDILDYCKENNAVYLPFWHDFSIPTTQDGRTESENLALIKYVVDYGLSIGLTFINVSDLNSIN